MKKGIARCLIALCALAIGSLSAVPAIAVADTEKTPIDMYLIAGQSNAAGYSTKGYGDLNGEFENIGYGGEVQRYFRTGQPSSSCYLDFEDFKWSVTKGLGSSVGYIGPEYGMAKAMNETYANQPDGRKAFFFKTAAGGTSLRDIDDAVGTTTGNYGNWYPKSLWDQGYKPNTATNVMTNDPTGYLYELFMENFEIVYNELKDNGYDPVVKGFVWMQGCQDLGYHAQYEDLLKTFITDIRTDLVGVTGDDTLNSMPFVIGKIATTFGEYNNPKVPPFNAVQQKVADDMGSSVETVETSDLVVVNADGSYNGTDMYHFNCQDMEKLGERFGEKLLELNHRKIVSVSSQAEGTVEYEFTDDNKLVFTLVPDNAGEKKYRVSKFTVNGVDVTESITDNTYTVDAPEDRTYAEAEFVEMDKFRVTYDMDKQYVSVVKGARQVYAGGDLSFELAVKDGFAIEKVTANGVELTPEEGVYSVGNVTEDVKISVVHRRIEEEPQAPASKKGCKGSIAVSGAAAITVAVLGAVLTCTKRRKEK